MPRGRVHLLGAGPGDPELITEKARRRLFEADLVLYDALVHPELLRLTRPDAERVFVGKRGARGAERQEAINARMIEAARAGKVVARLKGGDPYLFGRGSEEAEALAAAEVEFEVVPGVPSPLAATAYAGLSLTHRSLGSSIAFVTAAESAEKDRSSHDWTKLATATETVVLFMALGRLASLMELLVQHGRDPATPAAVIEKGSLPAQRTVVGTVASIAALARDARIGTPALVVVGEVVRLRASLRWFDTKPLFGRRVLVTRPDGEGQDRLGQLLRDEGAEPVLAPAIRIEAPTDPGPLSRAVASLGSACAPSGSGAAPFDYAVFTSQNGVRAFFGEVARQALDARVLARAAVVAIGPATAASLAAHGVRADLVPAEFRGEAAAAAILAHAGARIAGARVLIPRAAVAREILPETLRAAGAAVDVVAAYRNVPPSAEDHARLAALVRDGAVDTVTLTAPSTLEGLLGALGDGGAAALAPLTVASIGPVTTAAAHKSGVRVDVTATEYTAEGLVAALRARAAA